MTQKAASAGAHEKIPSRDFEWGYIMYKVSEYVDEKMCVILPHTIAGRRQNGKSLLAAV